MEHDSDQADGLLRQPSSHLSDYSLNSNSTLVPSPSSPPLHRHGHLRANSDTEGDASAHGVGASQQDGHGLGISNVSEQKRVSIARKPVGGKTSSVNPGAADFMLSPMSAYRSGESRFEEDLEESLNSDFNLSLHRPFTSNSDREPLQKSVSPMEAEFECRMKKRPESGRGSLLAVSILILSIYSTVFSGIWLIVALMKLRYGRALSQGGVPFTTASPLYAAFAKSIELSFVTVFITFIGQALSKRARFQPKGVTIAEMSMRSWVMQPGTMISHWESVRYAGVTILGGFTVLVALMAMIYTTASDALVTPVLKFGAPEHRLMYGKVSTSFANTNYIMDHCNTPIPSATDSESGRTCIQIEHSGQAYHNYMQYLTTWMDNISSGNLSNNLTRRPDPVGMLYDNTTLKGNWINVQDMSLLSEKYGRIATNVTMVMPHAGVVAAATDPLNGIMQPSNLNGLGAYQIQASVPSPVVNVLCADVSSDELAPMVFTEWPSEHLNGTSFNATRWMDGSYNLTTPSSLVHTAVDDLFGFDDNETHPIFSNFPQPYNTVFNASSVYGHNSIYLLAASATGTYTMCSLRVAQSPDCFTEYDASMSGGNLTSHCGDSPLAYIKSKPKAPNGFWEKDWKDVASEWGLGLSLNAGITDGSSAIARLLTQLIPTTNALDPKIPSISEALAVLAGCTLILSSQGAPFIHYWNYTTPNNILTDPGYQAFNATLKVQEYQSGGNEAWQGIFYVVLVIIFASNVFCLLYFAISGSHTTDIIEPQNLFSLSLNSPPSAVLDGSCGGSLEKEQLSASWRVMRDKERQHMYIESRGVGKEARNRSFSQRTNFEMDKGPIESIFGQLDRKRRVGYDQ